MQTTPKYTMKLDEIDIPTTPYSPQRHYLVSQAHEGEQEPHHCSREDQW